MKQSIFHVSIYEMDIESKNYNYNFLHDLYKKFPTIEQAKEYAKYITTDGLNKGYVINEEVCEI